MILNVIGLPTQKKKSQEKKSRAKKETSVTPPQKTVTWRPLFFLQLQTAKLIHVLNSSYLQFLDFTCKQIAWQGFSPQERWSAKVAFKKSSQLPRLPRTFFKRPLQKGCFFTHNGRFFASCPGLLLRCPKLQ